MSLDMTKDTFSHCLDSFIWITIIWTYAYLDILIVWALMHIWILSIWMASKISLGPKIPTKIHLDNLVSPNGYVVNRSPKSQTMAWGHFPYNLPLFGD